jgi:hypothetical protein
VLGVGVACQDADGVLRVAGKGCKVSVIEVAGQLECLYLGRWGSLGLPLRRQRVRSVPF